MSLLNKLLGKDKKKKSKDWATPAQKADLAQRDAANEARAAQATDLYHQLEELLSILDELQTEAIELNKTFASEADLRTLSSQIRSIRTAMSKQVIAKRQELTDLQAQIAYYKGLTILKKDKVAQAASQQEELYRKIELLTKVPQAAPLLGLAPSVVTTLNPIAPTAIDDMAPN